MSGSVCITDKNKKGPESELNTTKYSNRRGGGLQYSVRTEFGNRGVSHIKACCVILCDCVCCITATQCWSGMMDVREAGG